MLKRTMKKSTKLVAICSNSIGEFVLQTKIGFIVLSAGNEIHSKEFSI